MNRVPQQTINDIKRLADVCDRASRSEGYAFVKADLVPFLKMVGKGFVAVTLAGLLLHAPLWLADRERNPFSWTMNTQMLQLLLTLYVLTVIVTFVFYMKTRESDPQFLRYAAIRRSFDTLPLERRVAIFNTLEGASFTGVMPYAEMTPRQLGEILRVAKSVRLKQV